MKSSCVLNWVYRLKILYVSFSGGHTSQAVRLQKILPESDFTVIKFGKDRDLLESEPKTIFRNFLLRIVHRISSYFTQLIADEFLILSSILLHRSKNQIPKISLAWRSKLAQLMISTAEFITADNSKPFKHPFLWVLSKSIVFSDLQKAEDRRKELRKVLQDDFDLAVFAEENFLDFINLFFREIDLKNIKKIVVQYTYGVKQEWLFVFRSPSIGVLQRKNLSITLSRSLFPTYVNEQSVLPLAPILVLEMLKISPEDIWSGFIGQADSYLIDSGEAQSLNLLPGKIKGLSTLIEPIEISLNPRLVPDRSAQEKKVVAVFLTPNQTSQEGYQTLINQVLIEVKNSVPNYLILELYAHPRITVEQLNEIQRRNRVKIESIDFSENIHTFQVCVLFSSALYRIFEYLNIPIINWDIYNYNYAFPFNNNFVNFSEEMNLKDLMIDMSNPDEKQLTKGIRFRPNIYQVLTKYSSNSFD